jgi:hypothetical protein
MPANKGFLQVRLDARRKWESEVVGGISDFSGPIIFADASGVAHRRNDW